jgi:hypothetical protein
MVKKMIQNAIENEERCYHAWKCEVVDDRHRPNGRKQVAGCGWWSVYASRHDQHHGGLMATCRRGCLGNGGRGPRKVRLNLSSRRFYTFETREAAEVFCQAMNNQQGLIE